MSQELADELANAGLYDPAAPDAEMWFELFEHLAEGGASIEEMRAAARNGQLASAVADRTLFDIGPLTTAAELAESCGIPLERLMRVRLASGLPTDVSSPVPAWLAGDVAGFSIAAELFGEEPTLAFTRVLGAGAERVAEAAIALFLSEVDIQLSANGARPLEWAEANEQAAALVGVVAGIMSHLVREHIEQAVRRQRQSTTPGGGPVVEGIAIAFVDLVGSTRWAAGIPLKEQARALARFESAAWDIALQGGGHVVKLIGDEAMIVAPDPQILCGIVIDICAAVERDSDLPPARGAVGYGELLFRDGDYFGPLVNLVARSVKVAAAGDVVATRTTRDRCRELGSPLGFDYLGARELRGIDEPVRLYAVRRDQSVEL